MKKQKIKTACYKALKTITKSELLECLKNIDDG